MMNAMELLDKLDASDENTCDIESVRKSCYDAMNDDLNTAIAISHLF